MRDRFPLAIPDRIVIHHSVSARSTTFAKVERWHTAKRPAGNGWPAVGYHRMINAVGNSKVGRIVPQRGCAIALNNTGALSVLVMGNNCKPAQRWTQTQVDALRRVLDFWIGTWPHLSDSIYGHRDAAKKNRPTACPGLDISSLASVDWQVDRYWARFDSDTGRREGDVYFNRPLSMLIRRQVRSGFLA